MAKIYSNLRQKKASQLTGFLEVFYLLIGLIGHMQQGLAKKLQMKR